MTPLLFLLAALPGVLISWYIYRADKFEQEPRLPIVLCFMLGALATWPALQAATDPAAQSGDYYGSQQWREMRGASGKASRAPQGCDLAVARRLWDVSVELTGVDPGLAPAS